MRGALSPRTSLLILEMLEDVDVDGACVEHPLLNRTIVADADAAFCNCRR